MNEELRRQIEESAENALQALNNNCYIHMNEDTEYAYKDGYFDGAEYGYKYGYKEAIAMAKEWLIGHTTCDIECNENGEPLASSYIEGRKLALEIANAFETEMNELWEEKK